MESQTPKRHVASHVGCTKHASTMDHTMKLKPQRNSIDTQAIPQRMAFSLRIIE